MSHVKPRPRVARKLLTASLGVATISYVAAVTSCSSDDSAGGKDAQATGDGSTALDAQSEFVVGNLAPRPIDGSLTDTQPMTIPDVAVGNLVAPPPDSAADTSAGHDASSDVSSSADVVCEHFVGNLAPMPTDP
jgi:hypothetical protein